MKRISVVVPVYNEAASLPSFHAALAAEIGQKHLPVHEILYCDDGSRDETAQIVTDLHVHDNRVKLLKFSRNFGKEYALSAGIAASTGDAIITLDGDGQHPVELLPAFIHAWEQGAQVVVGIRTESQGLGLLSTVRSRAYYAMYNRVSQQQMIPGLTDYCLLDAAVQREFVKLDEPRRITRALIDWLGFERRYIQFEAKPREHGEPTYSTRKLFASAANGLISMSTVPLYVFGALGVAITGVSFVLGLAVLIEQYLLNDPLAWNFTGTAQLSILLMFLIGVVLMSQGLLALYISHILSQTQHRPLYIIDYQRSIGLKETDHHS